MATNKGMVAVGLVPLALGLGVIGSGIEMVKAGPSGSQPIRCEIQVKERGAGVTLEGVVFAKTPIHGSYKFRVSKSGSSGSSDIDQSGDFSAGPGAASTLGTVTLGGNSGAYVARLKVNAEGRTIECAERVGGAL